MSSIPSWITTWLNDQIAKRKADVIAANGQAVADYTSKCKAWVEMNSLNRDKGVEISPVPPIPHKQGVDDAGNIIDLGPFPDLKPPVLPEPVKPAGDGHSIAAPTVDLQAVALAVLKQIHDDVAAIKAYLQVK